MKPPSKLNSTDVFSTLYNTIESNLALGVFPGLIIINPRLSTELWVDNTDCPHEPHTHLLTFDLRHTNEKSCHIWGTPNLLEIENPLSHLEYENYVYLTIKRIGHNPLFNARRNPVFKLRNIEAIVSCGTLYFRVYTQRLHDPYCTLPLPKNLENYSLGPNIKFISLKPYEQKYHSLPIVQDCCWVFTYKFV